jgi:hypothetical protein
MENQTHGQRQTCADYYERFMNAFDEMIKRIEAHFVVLWEKHPEKRQELLAQIETLTCSEIEERRTEKDFAPLFNLIWEYALTIDFNRINIDRALHRVRIDIANGKVFPNNPNA